MLSLEDFETIFVLSSLLGAMLIAFPALAFVFPYRGSERFSELYVLGRNHMAEDYPFRVKANETYKVYLGVSNHMGSAAYYVLYMKLRNPSEPLPNSTAGTPSPLSVLYEFRVLLGDGGVWEMPVNFSLRGLSFGEDSCTLEALTVNGLDLHVGKLTSWDSENSGYYVQLFWELWIYDPESGGFSFHNRFVGIWLNATASQ